MLTGFLSWLGGVLASALVGLVQDWRSSQALTDQGRSDEKATAATAAIAAQEATRQAEQAATDEILASPDRPAVVDRLRHGQF